MIRPEGEGIGKSNWLKNCPPPERHNEVPTWNCYEQEESNWLIKPQQVDSSQRWRVACGGKTHIS